MTGFSTMASTALLKFLPEDGNPYKCPSTCSTIPLSAIIPSGVAIRSMKSLLPGVTRYAPTKSPPRSVSPYNADSAKKYFDRRRCDVAAICLIRIVIKSRLAHLTIDY